MEEEFRALLQAAPTVTALAPGGVHWGERPQGSPLPAVVLHVIDGAEGATLQGTDGLDVGRVQVDAWALAQTDAIRLRRAIESLLHGYRGGGFRGIFADGRRGDRATGSNEDERPFRAQVDFITNWKG